jgi:hypothetical protein
MVQGPLALRIVKVNDHNLRHTFHGGVSVLRIAAHQPSVDFLPKVSVWRVKPVGYYTHVNIQTENSGNCIQKACRWLRLDGARARACI